MKEDLLKIIIDEIKSQAEAATTLKITNLKEKLGADINNFQLSKLTGELINHRIGIDFSPLDRVNSPLFSHFHLMENSNRDMDLEIILDEEVNRFLKEKDGALII